MNSYKPAFWPVEQTQLIKLIFAQTWWQICSPVQTCSTLTSCSIKYLHSYKPAALLPVVQLNIYTNLAFSFTRINLWLHKCALPCLTHLCHSILCCKTPRLHFQLCLHWFRSHIHWHLQQISGDWEGLCEFTEERPRGAKSGRYVCAILSKAVLILIPCTDSNRNYKHCAIRSVLLTLCKTSFPCNIIYIPKVTIAVIRGDEVYAWASFNEQCIWAEMPLLSWLLPECVKSTGVQWTFMMFAQTNQSHVCFGKAT